MTSIATNLLPPPARVDEVDDSVVVQPSRSGIMPTHVPDSQLQPRSWTLSYERVHAAVADAIRRHGREHAHRVFDWTPPGETVLVAVMHRAAPTIAWRTRAAADCQVFLEEVLAHA